MITYGVKPKKCILNKHRPNKVTLFGRWNEIINITYRVTMISGNVTQSRKAFYRSQAWKIIVAQVIVTFWLIVTLQNNWYTLKIGGDWDSWGKQTERNAISYSVRLLNLKESAYLWEYSKCWLMRHHLQGVERSKVYILWPQGEKPLTVSLQ